MRFLCAELPPVHGLVKAVPEDFEVEEIAEELPEGTGEHLWLWLQKRGRSTQDVVSELGRRFRIPQRDIGLAGQKDRQAVTRQWVSVPARCIPEGADLSGEGWQVLSAERHRTKLRTGRLVGNHFRIRLRDAAGDLDAARACLARLATLGLPNYFGAQRFGREADNAERGRAVLSGTAQVRDRFKRRMYLSALQSELFNRWLDLRIDDGLFDRAVAGDLLRDRGDGRVYPSLDAEADDARVRAWEADPTGPMFGHEMREAREIAGEREAAVLAEAALSLEGFEAGGRDAHGTRRPARVALDGATVEPDGPDLVLAFDLERGAYATVVLAELTRTG